MLATFRRHLDTWVAKVFFALLVGVFVLWGVGDVVKNVGVDTSVATVAGQKIELPEVQEAYRRQLDQVTRMFGGKVDATPQMRKAIAGQALEQVITRAAMDNAVQQFGIAVPDPALLQAIREMAIFRGPSGQYDRNVLNAVLRNNNLSEPRFLAMMRADLAQRQLIEPIRSSVIVPDLLNREVFAFQQEKRVAEMVELQFAEAAAPEAPSEAQLQRWYDNHLAQYSIPERRRTRIAVLSPEIIGRDVQVAEDEIAQAYAARGAEFRQPERRSLQVLLAPDEAEATRLQTAWAGGADWAAMQKDNASAVELAMATRGEIPAPELAAAAFTATGNTVAPPVKSALGWHVFKVTAVQPSVSKSLDDVRVDLRARIVADKAADLVFERSAKIEDMLAGGTPLDELPSDFGLAAAMGTLDAMGNALDGTPAPIPGGDALRQAVIQAVFAMKKDQPAHLAEGPRDAGGTPAYFAVALDEIIAPLARPFAEVADAVRADWTQDTIRHAQETAAAAILAALKAGRPMDIAAAGLTPRLLPPAGRATGAETVPPQLIAPLFQLKPGEATMVETADGFIVAVLREIQPPDAAADTAGFSQTRDQLGEAIANDVQSLLTVALRNRAAPKVNTPVFNSIAQVD
ncbi:MAG: SurA N-terminal domain-containing protein [Alphaproteobacteria bacterium]|nr:SurA N-terminal domain-containing protein [Alphaproteobacteria bacterium]